jgi:hypothetical protein
MHSSLVLAQTIACAQSITTALSIPGTGPSKIHLRPRSLLGYPPAREESTVAAFLPAAFLSVSEKVSVEEGAAGLGLDISASWTVSPQ